MTLQDIASISGKPGLFKVLKPTRSGVILEAINEKKTKTISGANSRVSILKEISIYTTGAESSVLLEIVFKEIYTKHGKDLPITPKANENELYAFLETILPNFDTERVYHSDIKKMLSWYNTLTANIPELFEALVANDKRETEAKKPKAKAKKTETEEKPVAKKATAAKKKSPPKETK